MEFLAISNIKTILSYIKTNLSNQNIHLNDDLKYEKIIKKLCKKILDNNPDAPITELNNIAFQKIIPFITNTILNKSQYQTVNSITLSNLVLDTGTGNKSYVINKSVNHWDKFAVTLPNMLNIDKPTDIYLTSICIFNPSSDALFFVIDIEEFNTITHSNNPEMTNKIIIPNNSNNDNVFIDRTRKFVASFKSKKITVLNIEITNQDNLNKVFKDNSHQNRIIMTFDIIPQDF
jgi:hypothetical protein